MQRYSLQPALYALENCGGRYPSKTPLFSRNKFKPGGTPTTNTEEDYRIAFDEAPPKTLKTLRGPHILKL
jgi:hypothetical protein